MTTNRSQIERELVELLSDAAKVDPATIKPESDLTQLGIDSLKLVELIFEIEDRYGITIDYNANDGAVESAGALVDLVAGLIDEKAEANAVIPGM